MSGRAVERIWTGQFRNLRELALDLDGGITLVTGENGAGKTSLLEALFLLARGHSFRTRRTARVISGGEESAWVGVRTAEHVLGVQRDAEGLRFRKDGEPVHRRSEIAATLPVQLVNADHQRVLLDGPAVRRHFLDWGTFHVEPHFRAEALRYHQALRQRNAALRQGETRQAASWIPTLARSAAVIDSARTDFVEALQNPLQRHLSDWLPGSTVTLTYEPAPRSAEAWAEAFHRSSEVDLQAGHSRIGPHRSDLVFREHGIPAQEVLSRGQQKLLIVALLLAEVEHWRASGSQPLVLVDDLGAELDPTALSSVLDAFQAVESQVLLTALPGAPDTLRNRGFQEIRLHRGEAVAVV